MWDLLLAAFVFACAMIAIYHISDALIDSIERWLGRK
jgi:hypothetical protein